MRDQFRYTIGDVKKVLTDALNPNWSGSLPMPLASYNDGTQVKSGKPISEGGDYLVMVLDVRRAAKHVGWRVDRIVKFLNGEPVEDETVDGDPA